MARLCWAAVGLVLGGARCACGLAVEGVVVVDVAEEEEVEEEAEEDKEVGRRTCCFRCAACLSTAAKSKFSNASSSSSSKKLSTSNGTSALADVDDGGFGSGLAEINVGSGLLLVSALPSLTSSLLSSLSHIMIKSSKSSIF